MLQIHLRIVWKLSVVLAFCFGPLFCYSQSATKINQQDVDAIKTSAKQKLFDFASLLDGFSKGEPAPDMNGYYSGATQIFYDKNVSVIDDRLATDTGVALLDIEQYLTTFANIFPPDKNNSVDEFKIDNYYNVMEEDGHMYMWVSFHEAFTGKDAKGDAYKSRARIAEMIVLPSDQGYNPLIKKIEDMNPDKMEIYDNVSRRVVISNEVSSKKIAYNRPGFYEGLMSAGNDAADAGNYGDAFFYYKEAGVFPPVHTAAENAIVQMNKKMLHEHPDLDVSRESFNKLRKKGFELYKAHRYNDAFRYLTRAKEINSLDDTLSQTITILEAKKNNQDHLEQLYNNKAYDEAISAYADAIKSDPGNAVLYVGLGKCYAKKDAGNEALGNFTSALEKDPENADAYKWQGEYYFDHHEYEKAVNAYAGYASRSFDKTDPVYSKMTLCKGIESFDNKDYAVALDSFLSAVRQDSSSALAFSYLARSYYHKNIYSRIENVGQLALPAFQKSIALDDKNPLTHYYYGMFLSTYYPKPTSDHTKQAIDEIEKALATDPDNAEWNLELGMLYMRKGSEDNIKAIQHFTSCIEHDRRYRTEALRLRATCYYNLNTSENLMSAYKDLDEIVKKTPSDYERLGFIYLKLEKGDEARKYFVKCDTTKATICFGLAEVAYLMEPESKDNYLKMFEIAFEKGIPSHMLENDIYIQKLEEDKDFKKLERKRK